MALKLNASVVYSLPNRPLQHRTQSGILSFKPNRSCQNSRKILCSMNMAANEPDDPKKLSLAHIVDKARSWWDKNSPEPVKEFPWNETLMIFIQLFLDLIITVIKYLFVPVFIVTSMSEMSYCAHERKLYLTALPFLVGVSVAGVLKEAALEVSPFLKHKAEVPWHLIAVLIFSTLLKLPGPYYPYWGRILIPHVANGAIWRTLWFMFLWYRRPRNTSADQPDSAIGSH